MPPYYYYRMYPLAILNTFFPVTHPDTHFERNPRRPRLSLDTVGLSLSRSTRVVHGVLPYPLGKTP